MSNMTWTLIIIGIWVLGTILGILHARYRARGWGRAEQRILDENFERSREV